jgi:hypothetical protein
MKLSSKLVSGDRGDLNEFSFDKIDIKRIFVVSNVPDGSIRGYHAHKNTRQYLCCIAGKLEIVLDNGNERTKYFLEKSDYIYQDSLIWSEIKFIDKESKLLVTSSTRHNESDYIRDYKEFTLLTKGQNK